MDVDRRDEWLARTFVELADTLVADFDLIDFLSMLADRCVELLDGAEVGLLLADPRGSLQVMASSTERIGRIESCEVQYEEGPCYECYRSGLPVLNARLEGAERRWPRFAPVAKESGYQMVHALPLRLRDDVIGTMNVFDTSLHEMTPEEVGLTRAFADAATIGILQERTIRRKSDLSTQLQAALDSRVVVEQAKGIVAERLKVDIDAAFRLLRDHARRNREQLSAVAGALVSGSLGAPELLSGSAGHHPAPEDRSG